MIIEEKHDKRKKRRKGKKRKMKIKRWIQNMKQKKKNIKKE